MSVADAYSAMTMDRPHSKGKRAEDALTILSEGAGWQWDPVCVRAFIRSHRAVPMLGRDDKRLPPNSFLLGLASRSLVVLSSLP